MDTYWKLFADAYIWATCIYFDRSPRKFGAFYNNYIIPDPSREAFNFSLMRTSATQSTTNTFYQVGGLIRATISNTTNTFIMKVPKLISKDKCVSAPLTFSYENSTIECYVSSTDRTIAVLNSTNYKNIRIFSDPAGNAAVDLETTGIEPPKSERKITEVLYFTL